MRVAVLGSGPAGLLAAHAVAEAGHTPVIFSLGYKSEMFGAMYLHAAIPDVTGPAPDHEITIIKSGTREGYAKLVYGDPTEPVSWDKFSDGLTYGWSMPKAYDKLWELYEDRIFRQRIDFGVMCTLVEDYPIIFSTLPLDQLCHNHTEHVFEKKKIWVQHGPANPPLLPGVNDNDIMYYNGYPPDGSVDETIGFDWYRFSQLNGYQSWEFSEEPKKDPEDNRYEWSEGFKPLSTNCNCWPTVHRLGRFGRWDKQQLSHHAFFDARQILAEGQ